MSTSRAGPAVLGAAFLFIAATAGVTFFVVGDISEPIEPRYADYLWRPWSLLEEHETVVGAVSLIVFVITGAALAAARRAGRMPAPRLAQVTVLALFAAWVGLGYRVTTAAVGGANIGGGGVILLTPVLALVSVALVVGLGMRASRQANRVM